MTELGTEFIDPAGDIVPIGGQHRWPVIGVHARHPRRIGFAERLRFIAQHPRVIRIDDDCAGLYVQIVKALARGLEGHAQPLLAGLQRQRQPVASLAGNHQRAEHGGGHRVDEQYRQADAAQDAQGGIPWQQQHAGQHDDM